VTEGVLPQLVDSNPAPVKILSRPRADFARVAQTLIILGRPVVFSRLEACRPPHVPVPKPGPCKGAEKKAAGGLTPAKPKTRAKPKTPAAAKPPVPPARGYVPGRDVTNELDYAKLAGLRSPDRQDKFGMDEKLAEIARVQGFDGLSVLGSSQELRDLKRAGGKELWRGHKDVRDLSHSLGYWNAPVVKTGAESAEQMRTGPVWYGFGFYGNGIYAADNHMEARRFSDGPESMNRMVLHPQAKVIDLDALEAEAQASEPPEMRQNREADQRKLMEMIAAAPPGADIGPILDEFSRIGSRGQAKQVLTADVARYAAAKGYDVIRASKERTGEGEPYYVILNRTALTMLDPATRQETFAHIEACMPPHVAVPKPGPCPGLKKSTARAVRKAVAKKEIPQDRKLAGGYVAGRDIRDALDYDALGQLPVRSDKGDQRLLEIARRQGFDARPQVATAPQIEAEIAAGGRPLWRGVKAGFGKTAEEIQDEFRDGDVRYYGAGLFGNGIYFASDRDTARYGYSDIDDPGATTLSVLPRTAKTVTFDQILREISQDTSIGQDDLAAHQRELLSSLEKVQQPFDRKMAYEIYQARLREAAPKARVFADAGAYAMAKGYDALIAELGGGAEEIIVLNRSAVRSEPARRRGLAAATVQAGPVM
jgi:hypothetical protein